MYVLGTEASQARERACAYASAYGEPIHLSEFSLESLSALLGTAGMRPIVLCFDDLSPKAKASAAGWVRDGKIFAYGTRAHSELAGVPTRILGLPSLVNAYEVLREDCTDAAAAQLAKDFVGDVAAAREHLELLTQQRSRVLRCVDAIRAQDLRALSTLCATAVASDVTEVLHSLVIEHRMGELRSWHAQEVAPLIDHIEFIEQLLPTSGKPVANVQAVFYAIMFGVFYAYVESGG